MTSQQIGQMGWPRNVSINIIFGEYLYGERTVDSLPKIHVFTSGVHSWTYSELSFMLSLGLPDYNVNQDNVRMLPHPLDALIGRVPGQLSIVTQP